MDLAKVIVIGVLIYIVVYSIIDRICKCVVEREMAKHVHEAWVQMQDSLADVDVVSHKQEN